MVAAVGVDIIALSVDGLDWHQRNISQRLMDVAYGSGSFVAVGEEGTILTSADGATWKPQPAGTDNTFGAVVYGNGRFVAVGDSGTIVTSMDGRSWRPAPASERRVLTCVEYGRDVYCGGGAGYPLCVYRWPDLDRAAAARRRRLHRYCFRQWTLRDFGVEGFGRCCLGVHRRHELASA